jgi:hypothetical protein
MICQDILDKQISSREPKTVLLQLKQEIEGILREKVLYLALFAQKIVYALLTLKGRITART